MFCTDYDEAFRGRGHSLCQLEVCRHFTPCAPARLPRPPRPFPALLSTRSPHHPPPRSPGNHHGWPKTQNLVSAGLQIASEMARETNDLWVSCITEKCRPCSNYTEVLLMFWVLLTKKLVAQNAFYQSPALQHRLLLSCNSIWGIISLPFIFKWGIEAPPHLSLSREEASSKK